MASRRLRRCYNIAQLRKLAQKNMPAPMFHDIDGVVGETGVPQALAFLRKDIERDRALMGCKNPRALNRSFVREVADWGT